MNQNGYIYDYVPEHPQSYANGCIKRARLIAECALGKLLPENAVVHHVNSIRSDDRNSNLVICENSDYHKLLHQRTNAFNACGNPNWRKCHICKEYDRPDNLYISPNKTARHRACNNNYKKNRRAILKGAT